MKLIAEVANVHEGDFNYMKELVAQADKSGVGAIKFQYIIPEEFGTPESENYIELNRLKFSYKEYLEVAKSIKNMDIYYDVYGALSYKKILDLKINDGIQIKGIKFHTTNSLDFDLIEKAIKDFNFVFISVSGLTAVEINELMIFVHSKNYESKIALSYGIQNYPTKAEEIKLNKLPELKKIFNVPICLTDHLDGDDPLAHDIAILAKVMGYDYIEKHITLDRNRRLDDDHAAISILELKKMTQRIESVSTLLTQNVLSLSAKEIQYRNNAKTNVYAGRNINPGEFVVSDALVQRRQDKDKKFSAINLYDVLNKKTVSTIQENELITMNNLQLDIYGLIIVRSASSRLANKCYKNIGDEESIRFLIKRIKKSKRITKVIVCTTLDKEDDGIETIARKEGVECVRSSENVYERIEKVFQLVGTPDYFLRFTGDNVFVDYRQVDNLIEEVIAGKYDYYRHEKVIDGCDFEIINHDYYKSLNTYYSNSSENSEYMTLYLNNSYVNALPAKEYEYGINYLDYRFTLDYQEDLDNIQNVFNSINNPDFTYENLCLNLRENFVYKKFEPINKALVIEVKKKTMF